MKRDALNNATAAAAAAVLFYLTQRVQRLDEVVQLDLKVLNYIRCASLVPHGGARLEGTLFTEQVVVGGDLVESIDARCLGLGFRRRCR